MSDEKHPLRDALNRGISIASNPDIPAGEAAKQVFSAARAEFNAASAYTQRRKQRKQYFHDKAVAAAIERSRQQKEEQD